MAESHEPSGQYPVNHVVGVLDSPADASAAAGALAAGGFLSSEIHVACGSDAAAALRATTGRTGIVDAAIRIARRLGLADDEMEVKATYEKALADGRFVLIVDAPTETRKELATRLLSEHNAHAVAFLGRYSIEKLVPPNRE
jgi:hypothetical protein